MKRVTTLLVIFITLIYTKINGVNDIVDEAKVDTKSLSFNFGDEKSISSPTRTSYVNGDITVYKDKLKLSEAKESFVIAIKDAFDLPNSLIIQRGDNNISVIKSKVARNIEFVVKKSDLKANDKIIVITKNEDRVIEIYITK